MGHVHITTNKDKKLKSIAIITLTLLATATVHAGALAEMSGGLAEQQKSKLANQLVEIVSRNGGKVSFEEAYKRAEMALSQLDPIASQKGKSCLFIATEWKEGQEKKFKEELKTIVDTEKKKVFEEFATVTTPTAVDYIKYKCLENSEFLNK